jgi:minor tail protein
MVAGLGSAMLLFAALGGGAMVYAASKAAEFNSEIILLHTQARVATSQLDALNAGVLKMAGQVGMAPTELAKALYYIESVGGGSYTTAHALDELKAAAMGAAVGHAGLAETASVLASVMAVFPGMLPTQAMGQLDAIVGQGKMTMEDLDGALKTGILATLQSSGVSLADFGGALATMTDYAIPATQAANAMRMAIYLMDAPTAASNKVLKEFGLTTAEISSVSKTWTDKLEAAGIRHAKLADDLRKPGGIILALQDMRKQFVAAGLDANGQAEVIYKAFGGGKMGKAIITLYENIGTGATASDAKLRQLGFTTAEIATLHDRLVQKTALINQQTNLLGQNFAYITANDPVQVWKQLKSSIDSLVITLGQTLLPTVMSIMKWLTPIVVQITSWINAHKELTKNILIGVVAFLAIGGAALFIVGTLGMIAGSIIAIGAAGGIMATILPIVGILLAIGAALAVVAFLVITHRDQVGSFFSALGTHAQEVKKWFEGLPSAVGGFFSSLGSAVQGGLQNIKNKTTEMLGAIGGFFSALGTTVHNAWIKITTWVGAVLKELHDRPIYWITRMVLFVPGLLYQLYGRFVVWAGEMLGRATIFSVNFFFATVEWIKKLPGEIGALVGTIFSNVVTWGKSMINQAGNTSANFFVAALNWLRKLPGEIGTWLGNVIRTVVTWTSGLVKQATTTFGAFVGEIERVILQTDWIGLGQKILIGILQGLKSMGNAVAKGVGDAAGQIYTGFKDAFGIKSPSLVMAKMVGVPIMQGVVMGMQSEFPVVKRGFVAMTSQLPLQGQGSVSAPRNTSGDTTFTNNTDITLKLDEKVLTRVIDKRVHRKMRAGLKV